MKHLVQCLVNSKVFRYLPNRYGCQSQTCFMLVPWDPILGSISSCPSLCTYSAWHFFFFFGNNMDMPLHVRLDNILKLKFYSFHGPKCARNIRPLLNACCWKESPEIHFFLCSYGSLWDYPVSEVVWGWAYPPWDHLMCSHIAWGPCAWAHGSRDRSWKSNTGQVSLSTV